MLQSLFFCLFASRPQLFYMMNRPAPEKEKKEKMLAGQTF